MLLYWNDMTAGTPGLDEAVGSLTDLLDWALPQAGWAIEYTGTNKRVYRPGSGNRHRLWVDHSDPDLPRVRGCENASDVDTLIDPFPTPVQVPDNESNWLISSANPTWHLWVSETFFYLAIGQVTKTDPRQEGLETYLYFFGDVPPCYPGDTNGYNTVIIVRDTSSSSTSTSGILKEGLTTSSIFSYKMYWCRDISGLTKSSRGSIPDCPFRADLPDGLDGWQNRIYRFRAFVSCGGSDTLQETNFALANRGQMPHLWLPFGYDIGGLQAEDTFQDSAYNPAANFMVLHEGSIYWGFFETTETWEPIPVPGAGA